MADYYENDLSADDSLCSLEQADAALALSLHGSAWDQRAKADRQACADDPQRLPARDLDKASLRDASAVLAAQPWRGHKIDPYQPQPFPRRLSMDDGRYVSGIPVEIAKATALLAAHLVERREQSMSPEIFRAYQIGEVRGEFRAPNRDDLPRHVRTLITPFLMCGSAWSPVRP